MANRIDFRHELESRDYRLVNDGGAVIVISANDKQDRETPNYGNSETVARRYDSPEAAYMSLVRPLTQSVWKEFTVRITLKVNRGSFGIKYERQDGFRFCARNAADAGAIAGHHVKGAKSTIDTTRIVEIVDSVSVSGG